jgi:two-component system sensor kinase FixL
LADREQARLTVRSELDAGGNVLVGVSDNGVGLPDEAEEMLFKPFFTTKKHGIGIGLSSSRSVVEANGGRIWATRNPEGGVTFCFTLPCRRK